MLKIILKHNLIELAIITVFEKLEHNFKPLSPNTYEYYENYLNSLLFKPYYDNSTIQLYNQLYTLLKMTKLSNKHIEMDDLEYFKRKLDNSIKYNENKRRKHHGI